jgi:hypothetical protein
MKREIVLLWPSVKSKSARRLTTATVDRPRGVSADVGGSSGGTAPARSLSAWRPTVWSLQSAPSPSGRSEWGASSFTPGILHE